jgi:valyl-tRNA synthetase
MIPEFEELCMDATNTRPPELAKAYDPKAVEHNLYDWWDEQGYFKPNDKDKTEGREPFVVVMPPPNVTGVLHVGHALFVALEDIMVRWHRMKGDPTLWVPGADHAGIAGQWVVEKELMNEGLTRHDLGREQFLERVWEFMDEYRPRIREQMKMLGASADWSRFAFTMDEGPARAVRHTFKHLFDKGLIYRGERIISWCPRCNTAISDLEVKYKDETSNLWYLAYPVEGSDETIVVATTRPETMLGDTGIAVSPDDERYAHLVGMQVRLPVVDRLIPVVADAHVEKEFGTGAVKVTPAHDPNDFEIGQRHNLPLVNVMNQDASINENGGEFAGMTREEARKGVVRWFEDHGLLVKIEPHMHSVGHCDRCDTIIEPMVSEQWFVRMKELAQPAYEAAQDGRITFVPERFKGVYDNWLENIYDWTISRQLWWGHRIPIWYCDNGHVNATTEETMDSCPQCGAAVTQDPDVLDTWFSSGLWPFSTLGWPDDTEDLKRFYPSSVMETGYEILFVWVARMVFMGIEMMGEVPFHTVYLHGIVRDIEGAKMSKTKGNVIDPIEVSDEYGADALRYALVTQASPGNDSRLSLQKVEASRNFANKLWNATRFALRTISDHQIRMGEEGPARPEGDLELADRWILSRLDQVTASSTRLMETHLYGEAGRQINDFIWSELCDWYIEASKVRKEASEQAVAAQVLAYTIERSLRLLHPFMTFLTETLWQQVPHVGGSIMIAPWPQAAQRDLAAEKTFDALMEMVRSIRNVRSDAGVEPARWISADIYADELAPAFRTARREIAFLARIADDELRFHEGAAPNEPNTMTALAGDIVASLPMAGMVDLNAERARLEKELEEALAEKGRAEAQLSNESFVSRAPEKVVQVQRDRLARATEQAEVISARLESLADA